LEALISYRKKLRVFKFKFGAVGVFVALLVGAASGLGLAMVPFFAGQGPVVLLVIGGVIAVGALVGWVTFIQQFFRTAFHRKQINQIDELTPLENQTRRDVWEAVRKYVLSFLERTRGRFSLKDIKQEHAAARQIYDEGAREIREALSELSTIRNDSPSGNEEPV
jgi:hypothetical protein